MKPGCSHIYPTNKVRGEPRNASEYRRPPRPRGASRTSAYLRSSSLRGGQRVRATRGPMTGSADEAIQSFSGASDCFVTLAMTAVRQLDIITAIVNNPTNGRVSNNEISHQERVL